MVKLDIRDYILGFFVSLVYDYDKYFNELLKNSIKYGMGKNEFWSSTMQDYIMYQEAYYERMHEKSYIEGYYNYVALETIVGNLFKKSGEKPIEYPKMDFYSMNKQKLNKTSTTKPQETITKENLNQVMKSRLMGCY